MIDITSKVKHHKGSVRITDAAVAVVDAALKKHGCVLSEELRLDYIGRAFYDMLTSDYMKKSMWFRAQPAHTITGMVFHKPGTHDYTDGVQLVYAQDKEGHVIMAPSEYELPDNYPDLRVIEETKVQYKQLLLS